MRTLATARLKRARAVELVAEGLSYSEVANRVGFSHRGSAFRAVSKALAEREIEGVDGLRAVELARLDHLQAALWEKAMAGDSRTVASVVRIIDQRARLLGLRRTGSDPPDGHDRVFVVTPPEGNPWTQPETAELWVRRKWVRHDAD